MAVWLSEQVTDFQIRMEKNYDTKKIAQQFVILKQGFWSVRFNGSTWKYAKIFKI